MTRLLKEHKFNFLMLSVQSFFSVKSPLIVGNVTPDKVCLLISFCCVSVLIVRIGRGGVSK